MAKIFQLFKKGDTSISFRDKRAAMEAETDIQARLLVHHFYKVWLMKNCKMPF